ncbi:MAG: T9SS type A sorting domain-containing protein, partial [Bacteroidota bacterium]|nr:T9SS type A sorting domain-containing protein [Bacteroidota bacterium]MDX5430896.1 T9SS type A sorting domain-containing protein [Bacteroidota bacterium]MDX5469643.1 T9SS type A sorting domain-containing protein [Bacteroidota bacterium]
PILFDGNGAVDDRLYVRQLGGLYLSNDDSIYLSFQGVAGQNFPVMANMTLINHINLTEKWKVQSVSKPINFWEETPLLNPGYNGCSVYYGSFGPMFSKGGAYIKTPNGQWEKRISGLDVTPEGYGALEMSSLENGTLLALQWGDQSVYFSDSTACFPLSSFVSKQAVWEVFPNPATHYLNWSGTSSPLYYRIYDLRGHLILEGQDMQGVDVRKMARGPYLLWLSDGQTHHNQSLFLLH